MLPAETADRDSPDTAFVSTARIESVAADSFKNFKRARSIGIGIGFMTSGIEPLIMLAKGPDPLLGGRAVGFVLRLEEVALRFGEEKQVLEINRETVRHTGRQAVWFMPDDGVAQNPAAIDHFQGEAKRDHYQ